jgi:hypothetical protein
VNENCKFETRNPKFETISNDQKSESSKQAGGTSGLEQTFREQTDGKVKQVPL